MLYDKSGISGILYFQKGVIKFTFGWEKIFLSHIFLKSYCIIFINTPNSLF